jgi:hypothetical protein
VCSRDDDPSTRDHVSEAALDPAFVPPERITDPFRVMAWRVNRERLDARRRRAHEFERVAEILPRVVSARRMASADRSRLYAKMIERSRGTAYGTAMLIQAIDRYTPGSRYTGQERYRD